MTRATSFRIISCGLQATYNLASPLLDSVVTTTLASFRIRWSSLCWRFRILFDSFRLVPLRSWVDDSNPWTHHAPLTRSLNKRVVKNFCDSKHSDRQIDLIKKKATILDLVWSMSKRDKDAMYYKYYSQFEQVLPISCTNSMTDNQRFVDDIERRCSFARFLCYALELQLNFSSENALSSFNKFVSPTRWRRERPLFPSMMARPLA